MIFGMANVYVKQPWYILDRKENLGHLFGMQFDIICEIFKKKKSMPFDHVIPLFGICPSEILIGHKNL